MSTPAPPRQRTIMWRGLDDLRLEVCDVSLAADRLSARGTQLGTVPLPYRLDYRLETVAGFVTSELIVDARGDGWERRIELRHDGQGGWSCRAAGHGAETLETAGGELDELEAALDCDLGLCPLTNAMPVLRCGLMDGGEHDFVMAWVAVPALRVSRSEQRYEHVRRLGDGAMVRYVGRHRDFVGELELDADGLVVHYPELAERVAPAVS